MHSSTRFEHTKTYFATGSQALFLFPVCVIISIEYDFDEFSMSFDAFLGILLQYIQYKIVQVHRNQ